MNSSCDLLVADEGESVILSARSQQQFFPGRELLPARISVTLEACLVNVPSLPNNPFHSMGFGTLGFEHSSISSYSGAASEVANGGTVQSLV